MRSSRHRSAGSWAADRRHRHVIPRGKTAVPPLPPDFVSRPELFRAFDAPGAPDVGLVSAPAGYGKTLSLAGRVADRPATAWVTLDRHDDVGLLWSAILASVVRLDGTPAGSDLHGLVPPTGRADAAFLGRFGAAVEALPERVTLVLDDVHEVADPAAMDELRALLGYRPPGLRLLLSSRFDPPLPLARMRMEGRLWDLRADRLAFSVAETAVLVRGAGLALSPGQADRLQRRTGGWVAGLRMAVQAMFSADDPEAFLADFSGDDRSVADYLVGEVLDALPAPTAEFLTLASVADPLPGALAEEITGRTDAAEVLDRLARDTSLVAEIGDGERSYRVLQLLRTHLEAELGRRGPGLAAELHGRAARWWAAEEQPVAALEHATRADDSGLLTELLDRFALRLALTGNHRTLRRALASAPATGGGSPRTLAAVLVRDEDVGTLRDAIAAVLAAGSPDDSALAALRALAAGIDHLVAGRDPDGARVRLEAALDLARRHGFDFVTLQSRVLLAAAAAVQGDYRTMTGHSEKALDDQAPDDQPSMWSVLGRTLRAYGALYRAEPAAAHAAASEALDRAGADLPPSLRHALEVVRGAARADAGEPTAGLHEMEQARVGLARHPVVPTQAVAAALLENGTAMQLGLPAAAARAAAGAGIDAPAERALMSARAELGAGHVDDALAGIEPVLSGAAVPLLPQTTVEAHLVRAALAARTGDGRGARDDVRAALAAAGPLDLLRPFAHAAPEVGTVLAGLGHPFDAFAARALAAHHRPAGSSAEARLTDRERAVLALLPSLMSSDDIAAALSVSRSTVRTHVQVIYSKLGVQSRRAAVHSARERGLLPPVGHGPG